MALQGTWGVNTTAIQPYNNFIANRYVGYQGPAANYTGPSANAAPHFPGPLTKSPIGNWQESTLAGGWFMLLPSTTNPNPLVEDYRGEGAYTTIAGFLPFVATLDFVSRVILEVSTAAVQAFVGFPQDKNSLLYSFPYKRASENASDGTSSLYTSSFTCTNSTPAVSIVGYQPACRQWYQRGTIVHHSSILAIHFLKRVVSLLTIGVCQGC